MLNTVFYLTIGLMFLAVLFAFTSNSLIQLQKFFVALLYLTGVLILIITLILFTQTKVPNKISGGFILAYVFILPQIIARLINLQRAKKPLLKLPIDTLVFITSCAAIVFSLFTTFTSHEMNLVSGEWVYDDEYFRSLPSKVLFIFPIIIWFLMIGTQKTRFFSEGIFHGGIVCKWSDFENYSWRQHNKIDVYKLTLTTTKNVRQIRRVELRIPRKYKEQVESLLVQRLKTANESS
jgi:hypothetical protein